MRVESKLAMTSHGSEEPVQNAGRRSFLRNVTTSVVTVVLAIVIGLALWATLWPDTATWATTYVREPFERMDFPAFEDELDVVEVWLDEQKLDPDELVTLRPGADRVFRYRIVFDAETFANEQTRYDNLPEAVRRGGSTVGRRARFTCRRY